MDFYQQQENILFNNLQYIKSLMKSILLSLALLLGVVICGTSANIPQTQATAFDLCNEECDDIANDMIELGYSEKYAKGQASICKSSCGHLYTEGVQVNQTFDECWDACTTEETKCYGLLRDYEYCKKDGDGCKQDCSYH
ncbi:hypothetical protein FGO68_gene6373 [Halteria grandinella]|uniref:Transmembrane protein n=1 Tax=Halteria grandinella TaxID=5974 RepID=A0A8J8NMU7_HALGN|nr:hypothetical protein FGO68_gene6373 [Halteria grandinella]